MKKLIIIAIVLLPALKLFAQDEAKQDIGINMAGIFIKNQETVAPSIIYKYKLDEFQLRFQLALDGKFNSKNRDGSFMNGGGFGNFSLDTSIKFDPGKNVRYGLMAGIQKNKQIDNTPFSYYYGLDLIFMLSEFAQSGSGIILQGNGGFDTTKQRIHIRVSTRNRLYTYGIGIPVGITYKFGKKFYASLEAKLLIAYQKQKDYNFTETVLVQQFQEFVTRVENSTNNKGFDFGIKPLTGLCIGIIF